MAAPVSPPLVRAAPRISAPTRPQSLDPQRFPVIATIAPVIMSLAIYVVTKSPFALLFAGLGPLMAIGSLVDGRFARRRRTRSEVARFDAELTAAREEIREAHHSERLGLERASPAGIQLATSRGREAVRWGSSDPRQPLVRLGCGTVASQVTLDGASGTRGDDREAILLRELRGVAGSIEDGPIAVETLAGIGIVGQPVLAESLARSLALQLAAVLSPQRWSVQAGEDSWLHAGPHRTGVGGAGTVVFQRHHRSDTAGQRVGESADGDVLIATARATHELPAHLATVIEVSGTEARVIRAPGHLPETFVPEFLSAELAAAWAGAAEALAIADGLVSDSGALPDEVAFSDLPVATRLAETSTGLGCAIGHGADGPVTLDLVAGGPHAIVGGTTGSGKSELLITWLLSMARLNSPSTVGFLLFDFKGGASFGEILELPHVVGLVTDLDTAGASRAMASLGAELRHRERVLAAARVRSIDELPADADLARLVVVVDEFAALATDFPELNAQFGDIAARGRSLGIHLVLSTQRPVGVIRDAVLANTALRISLRVNNRPDSTAVIGTDEAAATGTPPGRAWISRDSDAPTAVQVARATGLDVAAVVTAWRGHPAPRRPWLDPLPPVLDPASLPPGAFGLLDLPAEQRQEPALWEPVAHGNVLVVGAGRSGKSTALAALAPDALVVPADVEGAWDALVALAAEASPRVVVIDDLDALITSFGPEYERTVIELISTLLRGSGRARHQFVIAAQRLSAPLQQLAALCDSRLLLRMSSRQEHLLAGGSADSFTAGRVPGNGHWRGVLVQVAAVEAREPGQGRGAASLEPRGLVLASSARPAAFARRCEAAGIRCVELGTPAEGSALRYADAPAPLVLVASSEGWQAHWNGLAALRAQFPLLIEGGSLAEFRSLSRLRTLPPPLADESATGWLVEPSGEVRRIVLP